MTNSEIQPFAQFETDLSGDNNYYYYNYFTITYDLAGLNLGYRSDFTWNPNSKLLTCHDSILYSDWNDPAFSDDLANIKTWFADIYGPRTLELLE